MPKKIAIEIKESVGFLEKEHSKAISPLKKDRIKSLLFVKQGKYQFQSEIGVKLEIPPDFSCFFISISMSIRLPISSTCLRCRTRNSLTDSLYE